jgi:hypothetical protein
VVHPSRFAYSLLLYAHLLLFVLWLGGDVGVNTAGRHFRRRAAYSLEQRLALLQLLLAIDMVPRTAWALMVPISLSLVALGGFWDVPPWLLGAAWVVGGLWLGLLWDAHAHARTARAARDRRLELALKIALGCGYAALGLVSLATGSPLPERWLAAKALLFGIIFGAAIMIDVAYAPIGSQLGRLIREGSSDATEGPLLATMNRTRLWVWSVYLLLLATAFIGLAKPF